MKGRHHQVLRILASALTAAAVVVPVTGAAGSSDGSARPKSRPLSACSESEKVGIGA